MLHGLRSRAAKPSIKSKSRRKSAPRPLLPRTCSSKMEPPLLSLPEHLLALVVSEVQAYLPAALTAACPSIKILDYHGQKEDKPRMEISLASCPPSLHTLLCSFTQVRQLGPLAERCTMLQTLNCSNTSVAKLGPLSACTMLQTLDCSWTRVADLGPLSVCTMLQTLSCRHTRVAELGPLSAYTMLRTLDCSYTGVAELGPLSACTMPQTLTCSHTKVAELGPLSACTMLRNLNCYGCGHVAAWAPCQHASCCRPLTTATLGCRCCLPWKHARLLWPCGAILLF